MLLQELGEVGLREVAGVLGFEALMSNECVQGVPIGLAQPLEGLARLIRRSVSRRQPTSHHERTRLYRAAELVGKWSMTDVFVVAILVALIHLGGLLVITPGVAALAFGGVVIVTMLAAHAFDPRLIWDQLGDSDD